MPDSRLTQALILRWARLHHDRTGGWPSQGTGPVAEAPGFLWRNIDQALRKGCKPHRRGTTLTVEQVLVWADLHRKRTGRWPSAVSGPVAEEPQETWLGINTALLSGSRGLPGGNTLSHLLRRCRGKNPGARKPLAALVSQEGTDAIGR